MMLAYRMHYCVINQLLTMLNRSYIQFDDDCKKHLLLCEPPKSNRLGYVSKKYSPVIYRNDILDKLTWDIPSYIFRLYSIEILII